jgi:hypothetical protein
MHRNEWMLNQAIQPRFMKRSMAEQVEVLLKMIKNKIKDVEHSNSQG